MADRDLREYRAQARSTDAFGRVLCSAREHHFVIDGPIWNGCPGEELTPGERSWPPSQHVASSWSR
jgi:hypothetical protein